MKQGELTSGNKPNFVPGAEWAEALRASRMGALRYIFLSRQAVLGLPAMFLGAFCVQLYATHGDIPLALVDTIRSGIFIGFAFFLLFTGIAGMLDWRGKRKLVYRETATNEALQQNDASTANPTNRDTEP